MKKFILFCALAFSVFALQSCKDAKFGVEYSLNVVGDADGNVKFNIPVGYIGLNGDADVDVLVTNDTTKTKVFGLSNENVLVLGEAFKSSDKDVVAAANNVNDWLLKNFSVTTADGTYLVRVTGYVKETLTGLSFSVDREFTNRTPNE